MVRWMCLCEQRKGCATPVFEREAEEGPAASHERRQNHRQQEPRQQTGRAQMDVQQAPTTSRATTTNTSDTRLRGPWLVTVRVGWVILTLINLLILVLGIPAYCCATPCHL